MQENNFKLGSLALYKIRPARVLSVTDKIEIELEGAKLKRVRPKDLSLLHPGPLAALSELKSCEGEITEAWELLAESETNLSELSELIYGEYTPMTAWTTWQLVADGLYFEGKPDCIHARSAEQVELDHKQRQEKAVAEQAWSAFLARLNASKIIPQDHHYLLEVERLALKQSKSSRILQILERQQTAENAHRLLVSLGYWQPTFNPYPQRLNQPLTSPDIALPSLPDDERVDLTHLPAFAIDDEGNQDPDDAISLDGDRIWVHVADVAALVAPDSPLDLEARARSASLYLPETTVQMLPWTVTEQLGLGLSETSPALSFGFRLTEDTELTDIQVTRSWVQVKRLSYAEADSQLCAAPLDQLQRLTQRYYARRQAAEALQLDLPEVRVQLLNEEVQIEPLDRKKSREMVTNAMLMAGEAAARFAQEREIPIPFATQAASSMTAPPHSLATMYACRRSLKPSQTVCTPGRHAGLGLAIYCRATSPLRRYADLVVHQQLTAHLSGGELLPIKAVTERMAAVSAVTGSVRKAERFSNLHWKLIYLKRNPKWRGEGVVVELQNQRATIIIPALAMETKLRLSKPLALDTQLNLELSGVDLADLTARFRIFE